MNNSLYEEYMRGVLGYQPYQARNTYDMNGDNFDMRMNNMQMPNMTAMNGIQMQELENCYPDIYRLVFPMVQNACVKNNKPITKELIDSMANEIYFAIEDNELTISNRGKEERVTSENSKKQIENRQRIIRNPTLNDLIRILIIRELLGRPSFPNRPIRPPHRPPMRPPMPHFMGTGKIGTGGFNRDYYSSIDDEYDLYEY